MSHAFEIITACAITSGRDEARMPLNATHYISLNLWQAQGTVKDEISFSQPLSCVVHYYRLILGDSLIHFEKSATDRTAPMG